MRKIVVAVCVLVLGLVGETGLLAQEPGPPNPEEMEMRREGPGMREGAPPQEFQGGPGQERGFQQGWPGGGKPPFRQGFKGPMDPNFKARSEKLAAVRSTAEAYKQLSDLYAQQGKVDEAVAQLKKIIDMATEDSSPDEPGIRKHLGQVYQEMAEIYMKHDRLSDAEVILNEGIEKMKGGDIELSSRLALQLGRMQQKAGKVAEAEKTFKRIIELNAEKLKK